MKGRFLPLFFLLFLPLLADEVRVVPLEYWQNASQWPPRLTVDQLSEASLAASGLEGERLAEYGNRINALLERFHSEALPRWNGQTDREKGESILDWMHEEVMTGRYRTEQTLMDVLLDRGDYNCVSSALLYLILTREAGLDTAGEETVDHAFCTLRLESGSSVDIETTTLMGFDPGTKKEFTQAFTGRTGFAYVAPGDYTRRSPASDKQMIALILQNRIALHQRKGEYGKAVGPAVDRWFFLPEEGNRKDMNDAFRNHVSRLNGLGKFREALGFLVPLSEEMGLEEENGDLISVLILNQVISLTNRNLLEEGEAFLAEWSDRISPEERREQEIIINERKARVIADREDYAEALVKIRAMKKEGGITPLRADELITRLHQNRALAIANGSNVDREEAFLNAMAFLDSLPEEERGLPGIRDHRNRYRQNWAVVIHNRWAALMNRGELDRAEELLNDALERDGTNPSLLRDREFMEKTRR